MKDNLARHLAINEAIVRAHRRGVDALRSGPGDFRVGLTLSMDEMVAEPGGEGVLEAAREILEDRFFRATEGDDFIGVQCYSRVHFGPEGQAPNEPGVPITQMGYEYWPQGVEHCARRAAAMTGVPVLLTESGIATEDDAERITYSARSCMAYDAPSMMAWTYVGTSCGACSIISSGPTGSGPSSDSTASIGRHSSAIPSPAHRGSGRWLGQTAWWHLRARGAPGQSRGLDRLVTRSDGDTGGAGFDHGYTWPPRRLKERLSGLTH